jgi:ATP/maltotriose-dependent transcriptional regulator MalT
LATVAYYQGDFDGATRLWQDSVSIYRELGDHWATGVLLGNLGAAAMAVGDFDRAVALHEENLSIARRLKDPGAIGRQLCNLAEAMQLRGDGDQGALLDEALELHRETHDKQCEISTLTLMANSALGSGEARQAARFYAESLSLCQTIGDRTTMANTALLERIAALALTSGEPHHAARLLSASEAMRHELGAPIMPYLRPIRDRCLEQITTHVDADVLHAIMAEGRLLDPDAAVCEALAVCERVLSRPDSVGVCQPGTVSIALPHNTAH